MGLGSLLVFLLALLVFWAALVWAVRYFEAPDGVRKVIFGIAAIATLAVVLQTFGIIEFLNDAGRGDLHLDGR